MLRYHFVQKDDLELINQIVTENKIEWAINKFDGYRAACPDHVFPAMLQNSLSSVTQHLYVLYRAMLKQNHIPKSWTKVNLNFIPKPCKASYYDLKSFRPISLTSFLLKTLERLLDTHIRETVLDNSIRTYQDNSRKLLSLN